MARPRKDGPRRVIARLKDGTTKVYLYDRRTGERIGEEAAPDAGPKPGTIAELTESYRATPHFKSRAPGTQKHYQNCLRQIDGLFGHLKPHEITHGRIEAIKQELAEEPFRANALITMISILFKHGMRTGLATHNPAANPGRLATKPREKIWSQEAEDFYVAALRPMNRLLFKLMLYTLQRFSDCLAMTKDQIIERKGRLFIVLRQQKTAALMAIPVHEKLEPDLRARMETKIMITVRRRGGENEELREAVHLICSPRGHPWPRRNASRAWDTDMQKAREARRKALAERRLTAAQIEEEIGDEAGQRRDLRRTGMLRLAARGATTPQIASLSGHSIDYCQRIIDTYVPRRTEVAVSAIQVWEDETAKVVMLHADSRAQAGQRNGK